MNTITENYIPENVIPEERVTETQVPENKDPRHSVKGVRQLSVGLVKLLSEKIESPLLLKDLHAYEKAIRNIFVNEFVCAEGCEDLNPRIQQDILEMDTWLSSSSVDEDVWKLVLENTEGGLILIRVEPEGVSRPDALVFEDIMGEEHVVNISTS